MYRLTLCNSIHSSVLPWSPTPVTVVTGAPPSVFLREIPPSRFSLRKAVLDTGSKQKDAFTVDRKASLEEYAATACDHREALLDTEASWLKATKTNLVVTDIVPLACVAAYRVGIPCVAVTNFSWDFIYSEYLMDAGSVFRPLIWQIAEDYSCAFRLLRLPGHVPMPAFREVIDVPLVVRRARKTKEEVYRDFDLPLTPGHRLLIFIYGGQPPGEWTLDHHCLPKNWKCIVCSGGIPPGGKQSLPDNFILAAEDVYTPDLIAASDAVIGKIGYGTASECLAHSVPLVFTRRDFFNEEPFLRKLLEVYDAAVEIRRRDFLSGNWQPYLERALLLNPCYDQALNGASVVADLLVDTVRDYYNTGYTPDTLSAMGKRRLGGSNGSQRLSDTIVWGYMMGRHRAARGRRESVIKCIPDWYTRNQLPPPGQQLQPAQIMIIPKTESATSSMRADGFRIVEGGGPSDSEAASLSSCPDTLRFISLLERLSSSEHGTDASSSSSSSSLPELRAARGLFRWEEDDIWVSRAPGRLDVMGGIADYSGSIVLQSTLAEACHVAVQRHPLEKQGVWKHMQPRLAETASNRKPMLRIVSLNADATNRGPAFDMDLDELIGVDGRTPISYEDAKAYFRKDPAVSWAAYVAGALVVLAHECGAQYSDGVSVLVSSEVPEGKGVSSSAAVEVATVSAVAAAYGIELDGRKLALLCQKLENCVVGAPCGVMDQMASSLGCGGALLALKCQPAEVLGRVKVPKYMRFWGIDSGIRHSVGGSDYGAVRVGAFMGLKIIKLSDSHSHTNLDYLVNLPVSEFMALQSELPERMNGSDFIATYGDHLDDATRINPDQMYEILKPTAHPIYENFRVTAFKQVLNVSSSDFESDEEDGQLSAWQREQMEVLGELMLQSHASYNACKLGSDGTDRLVELVKQEMSRGAEKSLFGAKITGGGCGGVVCVLGRGDEKGDAAIARVIQQYKEETDHEPQVFKGSSSGAAAFGWVKLRRQR